MPQEILEERPIEREQGLTPPERPPWCSPLSDRLLTILFVIFLLVPPVGWLLGWKGGAQLQENRNLAPAPIFSSDPVAAWPAKVEAYYDDHFGFRAGLVHFQSLLLHKYLKASNADAVVGKDGWAFYAEERIFEDFWGKSPFSDDELKNWKMDLEKRQALLARSGKGYLFVVAPDKPTIYPEMLPGYMSARRGRSRFQQLTEYLKKSNSNARILDLHEPLIQAKTMGLTYFPSDAHWNGRGFFVAYQEMCQALIPWVPGIRPQQLGSDYTIQAKPWSGGEWGLFGLPEENLKSHSEFLFPAGTQRARRGVATLPAAVPAPAESWLAPLYWEGPGEKSLLIFHDSFIRTGMWDTEQVPLAEHFKRTLLVGMQPTDIQFQAMIDAFHPDVVIEERAERFMRGPPAPKPGR